MIFRSEILFSKKVNYSLRDMIFVRMYDLFKELIHRLLYEGKVDEWEGLRMLCERMKVPNKCVFVDRGYRPETVALECRKAVTPSDPNPWNALLGEESNGYATKIGKRTGVVGVSCAAHMVAC